MFKYAEAYVRAIEKVNARIGRFISMVILAMIFIFIYEAIARYVFNAATIWALELGGFLLGGYFIMGGAYTLMRGGHVRMDALYERWSPRRKAIMDIATFVILCVYIGIVVYAGIKHTALAIEIGKRLPTNWHPILWPITMVIPIGSTLILLQGIAFFIKDISLVFRGKEIE
jgi:TRAP-type mannitol/chloroaromatic compound transport system permease small subunit